ncbi:hypothetical protein [uncultured Bradyrhizobium sp.]|uniref:DNA polymerase III subunit beta n=1 Tax=uncultured Bradyrhizobium sp. TaxID=199684 RepID=UPI0035CC8A34
MKFTVNAGELSAALRGPCDRARNKSAIAILKHIRFGTVSGRLTLLGHDMDSSSIASIEAEIASSGACAVPADPLARLIGALPKVAAPSFEIDDKTIVIKSSRSRYKLPILDAADMPDALTADPTFRATVTASDLDQLFQRPRAALNLRDERPVCHGMFLHDEGGHLCSVGTSGVVLMRFSTDVPSKGFAGAIIPRATADEILKVGPGELSISDRIISIAANNQTYSSKIIDTIYPSHFRKTIPQRVATPVTVDRDSLIECLNRLGSIEGLGGSDLIDISAGGGEISMSVVGVAYGVEMVECDATESKFVCLRSTQLLDGLKAFRGETLELHIGTERDPVRIIDPTEPDAANVIMPCASPNRRAAAA